MKLKDIIRGFEERIPVALGEKWDHCGLNLGSKSQNVTKVLFSYDVCKEVVDFAAANGCQLIVSHHPFRMSSEVSLNLDSYEGDIIQKCIKHDIALYCSHTNHDASKDSLNFHYLKELNCDNIKPLSQLDNKLFKLVTYIPDAQTEPVLQALFDAGAGSIGDYNECSFTTKGFGTFKGNEGTNPTIGKVGTRETVSEDRVEVIVPDYLLSKVIQALITTHPYEEVAYDIFPIQNKILNLGIGAIGDLKIPLSKQELIDTVKKTFKTKNIRMISSKATQFKSIAICTGSGSSLMNHAIAKNADVFITGDMKYHQAIEAKRHDLTVIDVGHYYSEQDSAKVLQQVFAEIFGNSLEYQTYTELVDAFEFI